MHVTMRCVAVFATVLSVPALRPVEAQDKEAKPRAEAKARAGSDAEIRRIPGGFSVFTGGENRAVIGVTMGDGGRADTLGVMVDDVTTDGPAAKAGIKDGDRITSINGVSLKVASADADDPELRGIGQRRLTRELGKIKPGDEVELHVATAGQPRTVRVKTVSASDLNRVATSGRLTEMQGGLEKRAALGLSVGSSGNNRDTLGLFISSIVNDGPADKAGIVEGERIASINGVDVRVPKEDAGDGQAASARLNRFMREVRKLSPGDKATLHVYEAGRYRDVSVTAGKASELNSGFRINMGDGQVFFPPQAPMGGSFMTAPGSPRVFRFDGGNGGTVIDGRIQGEAFDKAMQELRTRLDGVRERLNNGEIRTLNGGGFRIRTVPMAAPGSKAAPVVIRKVVRTA